jgi:hypothetical protein
MLLVSMRPSAALAQATTESTPATLDRPLRVFIDCRGPGCDQEFFRKELLWVDHVRDQKDADVHLLVMAQGTGGGGTAYTLRFIGHGQWEGQQDSLGRTSEAGETDDARRRGLAQAFALGLARFAALTPAGTALRIVAGPATASRPAQTTAAVDPWNFWVFRTNFNFNLNGEASSSFRNINAGQSANRTTDAWKINLNAGMGYNESRYDLTEGGEFVSTRRSWNVNGLVVKSLTDHWSAAIKAGASRSTFLNQKLAARVGPGVEYNVFPYNQSTERILTVQWTTGLNRFHYDSVTLFDRTEETKWDQSLLAHLNLRQPFGSVGLSTEFANYLDDASLNRFSFNADTEFRLTRGLSLRLDGNYQLVHDQLYLKRGTATNEEIIARQQQLKTSYRYFISAGFTYRFGSINNNVVNPRFGGGPGGNFF